MSAEARVDQTPRPRPLGADALTCCSAARDGNVALHLGSGEPRAARGRVLSPLGLGPEGSVWMEQVHGGRAAVVDAEDAGRGAWTPEDAVAGVDAVVTFAPGLALAVMVADCVPLLLADPGRGVAAVHAGRQGVATDVVGAALDALAPPDPAQVRALIGPAIGGCCYELEAQLVAEVADRHPEARATTRWGTPSLDLPAAVEARLAERGVVEVERTGDCTACVPGWFSHRRAAGVGRQAAVVVRGASVGAPSLHWEGR